MNNNGDFVFQATFVRDSKGSNSFGVLLFSNGKLKLLASSPSSLLAGDTESIQVSAPDINDNGTVVFSGISLANKGNNFKQQIFKFENNEMQPIQVVRLNAEG